MSERPWTPLSDDELVMLLWMHERCTDRGHPPCDWYRALAELRELRAARRPPQRLAEQADDGELRW